MKSIHLIALSAVVSLVSALPLKRAVKGPDGTVILTTGVPLKRASTIIKGIGDSGHYDMVDDPGRREIKTTINLADFRKD